MNYEPGLLIAGRYRLEVVIGTGGMGQVWRATDETLHRQVAVKVLRPHAIEAEGFLARFRAEALHSASLQHPNIVTVHDFGEGQHSAYLVMELVDGKPLSMIIRERKQLPPEQVRNILYQMAIALRAAHEAGVVHRDVKPANIVMDGDGYARLTDFGIARALEGSHLTQAGEFLGTAHYVSPEQAQGHPATPASDLYALAVIGHELLTGQPPFDGDSVITTALAHVIHPAPPLPESVPEPLRTTVMAGLAKKPEDRPRSAGSFADALQLPMGTIPDDLVDAAQAAMSPAATAVATEPAGPSAEGLTALVKQGSPSAIPQPGRHRPPRRRAGWFASLLERPRETTDDSPRGEGAERP
jgi:eukaryotic-like serine/threonine-protein kinase